MLGKWLIVFALALLMAQAASAFEDRGGFDRFPPTPGPRPPFPPGPPGPPGPRPPSPGDWAWQAGAAAAAAYVGVTAVQQNNWNAGPASVGAEPQAPPQDTPVDGGWGAGASALDDSAGSGGSGWRAGGGWVSD